MPVPTRSVSVRAATAARNGQRVAHVAGHEVVVADRRGVEPRRLPEPRQLERRRTDVQIPGLPIPAKIGNENEKFTGGATGRRHRGADDHVSLTMPMRTAWRTAWVRSRALSFS